MEKITENVEAGEHLADLGDAAFRIADALEDIKESLALICGNLDNINGNIGAGWGGCLQNTGAQGESYGNGRG